MYEGAELSARTVQRLRREATGAWAAVFDAAEPQRLEGSPLEKTVDKEKALAFLLGIERNTPN